MDPLKYLFEKFALSGGLLGWLILLAQFNLKYMARKTIKGSDVLDFCAHNPVEGEDGREDFPNEDILDIQLGAWKMYFNGAMNQYGNGIGVLLITSKGSHVPLAIKLNFEATNNMADYEACIAKVEALQELGVKEAEVFGDSILVIAQAQRLWKFAVALTTLASMVQILEGVWTQLLEIEQNYEVVHKRKAESSVLAIEEEGVPWYYNILKFLELEVYPNGANKREIV
ncbi:uncharacterized protein LOC112029297 [Quercus suber]|uniref:uncharacterized protein LOC112029297 n=1 Tax=Quercus suber TaxID=58331 RepID=UPI0032DFAF89